MIRKTVKLKKRVWLRDLISQEAKEIYLLPVFVRFKDENKDEAIQTFRVRVGNDRSAKKIEVTVKQISYDKYQIEFPEEL